MTSRPSSEHRSDVLVVTHYFPSHGGGIERVAERLVDLYLRRGKQVEWISSNTDAAPAERAGLRVHPVATSNAIEHWTHLPYPLWSPAGVARLWAAVGRSSAVHVHEHLYLGSLCAVLFGKLRRRRVVLTQHMGELRLGRLTGAYRFASRALACLVLRMVDHVAFVSANVAAFFGRSAKARGRLVFNGLDTTIFRMVNTGERIQARTQFGLPDDERPVAIFAGRYVHKKGLHLLREIATLTPQIRWLFAGSGPIDPSAWGLSNVTDVGQLRQVDLARAFTVADVLVLPSRGEGFPLVVQEALACGTAILSTGEVRSACPAASPLIHDLEILEDGADAQRWAARLGELVRDERSASSRSVRSSVATQAWSWEACADAYLRLLEQQQP